MARRPQSAGATTASHGRRGRLLEEPWEVSSVVQKLRVSLNQDEPGGDLKHILVYPYLRKTTPLAGEYLYMIRDLKQTRR